MPGQTSCFLLFLHTHPALSYYDHLNLHILSSAESYRDISSLMRLRLKTLSKNWDYPWPHSMPWMHSIVKKRLNP